MKIARFVPIALLVMANIRPAIFLNQPIYKVMLGAQILFYTLALCGVFFRKQIHIQLIAIPYYFVLEQAASIYGIYKGLFDRQSVKWQKFKRGEAGPENA